MAAFAYEEGEGDRSLAVLARARTAIISAGKASFSEDMMLMCERFRLVEVF